MKDKIIKILDYAIEYSLYGLITAIPISNAAIESFFGFAFLFFLLKKIIKPDFKFLKTSVHIFLLAFIFFMGLSLFNSGPYIIKGIKALSFKWLEYILIFIITQDTLRNSKIIRNCLVILLSLAFLICIDALFQRFIGTDFLRHKNMTPLAPGGDKPCGITASFHHYNSLGTYLVFNLSLVLALLISVRKRLGKIALYLLTALLLVCLFLTFSRGNWVAFIAVITLMLFLSPEINKLVYVFVIFIVAIFIIPWVRTRVMLIFTPFGDADRIRIWKGTLGMIRAHPFLGMGLGTYMDYFHKYIKAVPLIQYAHNCFLQIWAESGIFALLSFVLFVGAILYRGIKVFITGNCPNFILLGFICALFGFMTHCLFDSLLYSLQLSVLFWFMTGFIVALIKLETQIAK